MFWVAFIWGFSAALGASLAIMICTAMWLVICYGVVKMERLFNTKLMFLVEKDEDDSRSVISRDLLMTTLEHLSESSRRSCVALERVDNTLANVTFQPCKR